MTIILQASKISKTFSQGGHQLTVLNNVDAKIEAGEVAALVGPSGSGKSTLLQILGLLDKPSAGLLKMGDKDLSVASDKERTKIRREDIGFVYQFHHLLPEFSALENVNMPQIIAGKSPAEASKKSEELLKTLGLGGRIQHRPGQLSGGEQQRVAIARALANDPKLLLADEPTGNLDPETSSEVFDLLMLQAKQRGIGALIATHNLSLADQMDRVLELKSGRLMVF